jgi:hypothetical protein
MAENYLVSLNDELYFTDDGTETGAPCRVPVEGVDQLRGGFTGATIRSAANTPYTFVNANTKKGTLLQLKPVVITSDVIDSLETLLDTATAAGETINLKLTDGTPGDFDLEVTGYYAEGVRPISFSTDFVDDFMYGAVISLVVAGVN